MKIFSAPVIRVLDAYTIKHEPIMSIDLMERASAAFSDWFIRTFSEAVPVYVFCGPGNNGGDGLAIARRLLANNYKVFPYLIGDGMLSEDCRINFERLSEITPVTPVLVKEDLPGLPAEAIVVDALFGSGLSRPVAGLFADVIQAINHSEALVVSVDIASGLFCDSYNASENIVRPDYTVTFQYPKLSFFLPSNALYTGELVIVNIGLMEEFAETQPVDYYFIESKDVRKLLKPRGKYAHKGTFGKALIMAGSYGMMGAALLAVKACCRSGAGLVTAYIPKCGYEIIQTAVPEAMVLTDPASDFLLDAPDVSHYNAIGAGPGFYEGEETVDALRQLLITCVQPLVLDAGALNCIAKNRELLDLLPEGAVITPHPKEFERLFGATGNDYDRLGLMRKKALQHKITIVLKGAHTAIATSEGKVYFNSTGNPGMATGGTGDVLTGIITGLLAQGYPSPEAAILGVYLHGYAGDKAAQITGVPSLLASDVIDGISLFYKDFY